MTILSSTESARRANEGKDEVIFIASPRVKYLAQGLKVVVFLSLFFIAFAAQAANPLDVVINELAWMGTNISANDEWIELYNNTESPINLDGWQLVSQDGTPKINLSGTIPANGFYLLERTDDTTVPNVPVDQIYTGALGNGGETLELYDNFGNLIDRVDDSSGWFAGDNSTKQTMERKNPQFEGSDPNNWQTSQNAGGTPKAKNSIVVQAEPQPKPESEKPAVEEPTVEVRLQQTYPTGVVINEILPSPEGPDSEEEWIEIFNQNNFEVDLSKWQIADTAGGTFTYTLPAGTKISAQGFLVLPRPESKITLNNDEDGLLLIQPNGNILDKVNYQKAPLGQSYNKTENSWVWSSILTPGSVNIMSLPATQNEIGQKEKVEPNKELQKNQFQKQQLADIGEQLPKAFNSLHIFLIALGLAVFSGIIILILKNKIKKGYNKEV